MGELAPRLLSSCLAEAQPFQLFSFIVSVPQGGGSTSERDVQTPAQTSPAYGRASICPDGTTSWWL